MNSANFLWIIHYASIGSVLIPLSAYVLAKKKNRLRNIVLALLLASLVSDVGNWFYTFSGHRSSLITNVFFVCQITLLCLFYVKILTKKTMVKFVLWSFPFLVLGYSIFFQSIDEYQSAIRVVGGIVMIVFSVIYFGQMYRYLPAENLIRFLKGWINIAVFWYFSFNLFLFACANFIFQNESTVVAMAFWSFHNLNNIIKNCILAFGLYNSIETYTAEPEYSPN